MKVAYGPPGQSGVQTLMHVGDDGLDGIDLDRWKTYEIAGGVGMTSAAVWALATLCDDKKIAKSAFVVSIGAFLVGLATQPK